MEVKAKSRFLRLAPRKVRLVVDVVRGLDIEAARRQLQFMHRSAALPILKLINSAAANATHNNQLDVTKLFIKSITADVGPTYYRYAPRAMGRATPVRKRTTHVSIILAERTPSKAETKNKKNAKK